MNTTHRTNAQAEAGYWQGTNVVRRNLLLRSARQKLEEAWDPLGDFLSDEWNKSLSRLKALSTQALTDSIVSFSFSYFSLNKMGAASFIPSCLYMSSKARTICVCAAGSMMVNKGCCARKESQIQ